MRTPVARTGKANWEDVIGARDEVLVEGFEVFRDHLVVIERSDGLRQMRIRFRFGYESMKTPESVYDYDMRTREKLLLKQEEVLGGFDTEDYVTERLYAPARDGARIPISLVYRKGAKRDGNNPLVLYGYGSYGASIDASFGSSRLSLLDRGFGYAIAHIRGGQELGRAWYDDGKLLNKKNTFTDFIDSAEYLIEEGYTSPDLLFARGGSAGGLLMGAVANMRPDLWKGVVAHVPFVDVVTTMLDESIRMGRSR
jgi:oligopeptidase B